MHSIRAGEPVKDDKGYASFAQLVRAWLRDHSVAAVALGVTLLAAAGYCVHRSWLFGWYQAAGIPAFAHGWSVQDVVMQGILNLSIWLFGLLAIAIVGVMLYLEFLAINWAEKLLDRYLAKRRVRSDDDEEEERPQKVRGKFGAHAAICVLFVASAALLYCLIALTVFLLSAQPRKLGHAQFLKMERTAETTMKAWMHSSKPGTTVDKEVEDANEYMRASYRYVRATVGQGESGVRHCGWLVLQNGEHMLLLGRNGPMFLSASGLGFSWTPVKLEEC